jgi:UDP-N-acetylmuramate--alanine ligase
LSFFPTVAVILNIEADHLDFFKDLEDVEHSFRRFADLVPEGGASSPTGTKPTPCHPGGESRPVTTFGLRRGTSTRQV